MTRFAHSRKMMLSFILVTTFLMNWLLVCPQHIQAARSTQFALAKSPSSTTLKAVADNKIQSKASNAYDALPMSFEANLGQQPDARVKYLARARNYELALTNSEAVFTLRNSSVRHAGEFPRPSGGGNRSDSLKMKLRGGIPSPLIPDSEEVPWKVNYFMSNDPASWRTEIPAFSRVVQKGVYKGIDIAYYGKQDQLEYDFIVAPGSNPGVIALEFEGLKSLRVDSRGDLILSTARG